MRRFAIRFLVEFATTPNGAVGVPTSSKDSAQYKMFNGVIQYDDVLDVFQSDFGYNMNGYYLTSSIKSFLTTAPTTQYARLEDYGTFSFLNYMSPSTPLYAFVIEYYYPSGSSSDTVEWLNANGGRTSAAPLTDTRLAYFGAFPANLKNWSAAFIDAVSLGLTHYTVTAIGSGPHQVYSQSYTINIICPNERGYEGIRLTWLNQWGTWDYYTFNMKSTKSIQTKRTSYTQLGGTWNDSAFKISGYKGGKKNFRVNSTEKIKLNTDFVSEAEGVWFEELINSPEVYVLEGYQTDPSFSSYNTYVQPATIINSSYIRKTKANDRLMQYTIEIEKSKMKRTQSV